MDAPVRAMQVYLPVFHNGQCYIVFNHVCHGTHWKIYWHASQDKSALPQEVLHNLCYQQTPRF